MAKNKTQPGDLPFDESLLTAAEERYRELKGNAPGPGNEVLETLEVRAAGPAAAAGETTAPTRVAAARRLIQSNPREAIARRLRRIGVRTAAAEETAEALAHESFPVGGSVGGLEALEQVGLERIIGRNELLGIQYLDGGQAASRSVARVVIRDARGTTVGFGTGSLVSPRLFLTNNHVLRNADEARRARLEFNFQDDLRGQPMTPVGFRFLPDVFFTTSPLGALDFTLVAVAETSEDGATPLSRFGFNPLGELEGEILAGESVTIIQHPNGEPKQIALRENLVLKFPEAGDAFLHYQTDTTPGSSGSPVYNDQWELVALHHSGFPRRDNLGRILARDGSVWTRAMGEQRIDWIANEGIRARAIVGHLKALQGLTNAEKALVDAVLNASPGGPETGDLRANPRPDVDVNAKVDVDNVAPPPVRAHVVEAGAQAVWTIPLQVSVTLGSPTLTTGAAGVGSGPARPDTRTGSATATGTATGTGTGTGSAGTATTTTTTGGRSRIDDDALRAARDEVERARTRTYLDESAESDARAAYYRGLDPGDDPAKFFDVLGKLLTTTHTTRPGYAPSKQLYPWVDLQPDKRIKSIYSGEGFDPMELIEADLAVDRERSARLEAFRASEAATSPEAIALEEALLEASLPYNCEHTVPQSWFNKAEPMRGDLHHLFACESGCNSFRGNTPYFDFRSIEEVVRVGCGRREPNRFQPTAGMGAVARATLYFLLRYPKKVRSGPTTYTRDRIDMLLAWHQENPVGKYERHRNQAIFEVQKNRNPLIDHPEWASKIDFTRGLA